MMLSEGMDQEETDSTTVEEDSFGFFSYVRSDGSRTIPTSIEPIRRFTLINCNRVSVQVITYGAAITSIKVPDKFGNFDDVVLGFDNVEGYLNHQAYFGATIGRFANRIGNATFKIRDQIYRLEANDGSHHLHGGFKGFDKIKWESHVEGNTVTFTHIGAVKGYPGKVVSRVNYRLTDDNELQIEYRATASQLTPINITNHSYFNLGGHNAGSISDHFVTINADRYTPMDETLIPTGEIAPVEHSLYDLRSPTLLDERLSQLPGDGYDTNFCIKGDLGEKRFVARVHHPTSGRILEVYSTQPGVQLYTGNGLPSNLKGKDGATYGKHAGLCLETQNYPDAINKPNFPDCKIGSGDTYLHTTVYKFSTDHL